MTLLFIEHPIENLYKYKYTRADGSYIMRRLNRLGVIKSESRAIKGEDEIEYK